MTRLLAKGPLVLTLVVLGVVVLAASSRTWVGARADVLGSGAVAGSQAVTAAGTVAAPGSGAIGLVVLAAAGALLLARPVVRLVVGALVVLAGATALLVAGRVLLDPTSAVLPAVAEASGLTSGSVTAQDVSSVAATGWPWAVVVAAVLVVLAGPAVLVVGRRWDEVGRFERSTEGPSDDDARDRHAPADDWDALSRGEDPTAGMMDP